MKVIDLLNKIANTKDYKDIPKKVKITTGSLKEEYRIWVWDGLWYAYEEDGEDVCICTEKLDLNDKVEIIEENKVPDKLETYKGRNNEIFLDDLCYKYTPIHKDTLSFNEQVIVDKLNQVINYLKKKE